jgi:hypothetical protein
MEYNFCGDFTSRPMLGELGYSTCGNGLDCHSAALKFVVGDPVLSGRNQDLGEI